MYCRRCDKEGVGSFHRCFVPGATSRSIRPLQHRPKPNTPLARKLAKIYECEVGVPFPGGIENARIVREAKGMSHAYRHHGSWVWYLNTIDGQTADELGSQWTAVECAKAGKVSEYCGEQHINGKD